MRTVIAVDLNTMRELADEETRVRFEKTDWSAAAYREEAIRRVEERRETQKMLEVWEARRLASLTAIGNVAFGAMTDLYMATVCYSFSDHAVVREAGEGRAGGARGVAALRARGNHEVALAHPARVRYTDYVTGKW